MATIKQTVPLTPVQTELKTILNSFEASVLYTLNQKIPIYNKEFEAENIREVVLYGAEWCQNKPKDSAFEVMFCIAESKIFALEKALDKHRDFFTKYRFHIELKNTPRYNSLRMVRD
jgi:hypothetical protein